MCKRFGLRIGALAVLAAALLLGPQAALAQRGGHGGSGGHHASSGGYHGGSSGYHGGSYHGGHYYHSHYPYSYGGYYPYWYYGYYPYAARSYYYDPGYAYPPPADYGVVTSGVVQVTVRVPDPNAQVWFGGVPTTQRGPVRQFQSPPLAPGRDYVYEVTAQWNAGGQSITQTRQVRVLAGANVVVDFGQPAAPG